MFDIISILGYNIFINNKRELFSVKFKHLMWILTGLVAVVSMAAGVAVLVNRYLNSKKKLDYIECDCDVDSDLFDEEEITD